MKKSVFIGIDVSKDSSDVAIFQPNSKHKPISLKFANHLKGFSKLLTWLTKKYSVEECLFCLEDTGNYSVRISYFLDSQKVFVCVESAYRIKPFYGYSTG